MPDYTPRQRRIIRDYYDNRTHLMIQKLGEIVSELAVAETDGERKRLWARAEKALKNLKVPSARIAAILEAQDPQMLAQVVEDFF